MERSVEGPTGSCKDMFLLIRNWGDWTASLRETISAAREIDPSEGHVMGVVEDMIDFLTSRVHSGSSTEKQVAEIWNNASREERDALIRCFIKEVETVPISGP
jgi:hypothetical protein